MSSNFIDLGNTQLTIGALDNDKDPPVLYIDTVGNDIIVTCLPWDNIRTDQTAILYINNDIIQSKSIESLDPNSSDPNLGKAPFFMISVADHFIVNSTYTMKMKVNDGSGNSSTSKSLIFIAENKNTDSKNNIKIDITEGAAGYLEQFPYLMPANIAVIRGPAGKEYEARSHGVVRFQDVGGAETCIFSLDDNGVCPLTLIRIDSLHPSSQSSNLSQLGNDRIIITERGKLTELKSETVIFGEYSTVNDPTSSSVFKSISSNTTGISDGTTMCIISIIAQSSSINDVLYIKLDDGLSLANETFNKAIISKNDIDLPSTKIINGMAEFGVITDTPGDYKVGFFPQKNPSAYITQQITFKALS